VTRLRGVLEQLSVQAAESDLRRRVSMRTLLKHRGLIVLLTDLDDANIADQLSRAVRLLSPPHLLVVAGVHSGEIAALAQGEAREWLDPWIALAAPSTRRAPPPSASCCSGSARPVVAAPAERLEQAVFAKYEALRRSRRV